MTSSTPRAGDLEQGIAHQREELAATVDELQHRVDPRIRAREGAHRLQESIDDPRSRAMLAGAGAVVIGFVVTAIVLRRRARGHGSG